MPTTLKSDSHGRPNVDEVARCSASGERHNRFVPGLPSQGDLILRLLLAAALAGLLGGERELTEQPAGFRTHILVGLGAALFTIISAYGFQSIAGLGPTQ